MGRYSVVLKRTASTTLAVGSINAGARRVKIVEIIIGSEGTPADNAFLWRFQRCTDDGTGTSVTPQALDQADAAEIETTAAKNHTVNPSLTSDEILLEIPLNQRATIRWVAPPGGELVIPATSGEGIAILTPTAAVVPVTCTIHFEE